MASVTISGVDSVIAEVENAPQEVVAGSVIELTGNLAAATPVDTGYARNSWIATEDESDAGTPGANDPSESAIRVAKQYTLSKPVYINNGAAYIGRLNDGHSQQAPSGFVDMEVQKMPAIIEAQIQDIKGK